MRRKNSTRESVAFASVVLPGKSSGIDALLLAESVRAFGGSLSHVSLWYFVPTSVQLSTNIRKKLDTLGVVLFPCEVSHETLRFPFASYVRAAASAESKAVSKTNLLVWLGANTIIVNEPKHFLLSHTKNVGYRPVHHTLVGSQYDMPLDNFWKFIYEYCNVPNARIFPMKTHIDGTTIRPYFNAGLLVTRPGKSLLHVWDDMFTRVCQSPEATIFYEHDERYAIFMHQAVLSGVILSRFARDELQELPSTYNYPSHLYADDVTGNRPSRLEDLVTFRHEEFYNDPEWMNKMPAGAPLKKWLGKQLSDISKE